MSESAPISGPTRPRISVAAVPAPIDQHYDRVRKRGPRTSLDPRFTAFLVDILLVCFDSMVVFYLRFFDGLHLRSAVPVFHYLDFFVLNAALVAIFCQNEGLYDNRRSGGPLDQSFAVLKAVIFASLFLAAIIYLSGDKSISRLVIASTALLNAFTLPMWRFWEREVVKHRVANGKDGRHVLIVGAGEGAQALARHFDEHKYLGYVVKGFVDTDGGARPDVIRRVGDLGRLALVNFVDEVFITTPLERRVIEEVILQAREAHLDVKVVPELYGGVSWPAPIRYLGEVPIIELLREPIPAFGVLVKRVVDVLWSSVGLLVLSPVIGLIAVAIRLDSRGPIIYRSRRVGWKGRKFFCYKFRTMVANADDLKDDLRHMNERNGPFFKIANDPRVTGIGSFLRRYSLDELPQLWNVLCGDMSLVGPRPHPLDDYERYQPEHLRRLDVRPGITCLWQVYARQDPSFDTNLALDLEYIENWSLWLDCKVLLKTLPVALSGSGR